MLSYDIIFLMTSHSKAEQFPLYSQIKSFQVGADPNGDRKFTTSNIMFIIFLSKNVLLTILFSLIETRTHFFKCSMVRTWQHYLTFFMFQLQKQYLIVKVYTGCKSTLTKICQVFCQTAINLQQIRQTQILETSSPRRRCVAKMLAASSLWKLK